VRLRKRWLVAGANSQPASRKSCCCWNLNPDWDLNFPDLSRQQRAKHPYFLSFLFERSLNNFIDSELDQLLRRSGGVLLLGSWIGVDLLHPSSSTPPLCMLQASAVSAV
jgi:hypothetical protein